jgi:hypothetical protein
MKEDRLHLGVLREFAYSVLFVSRCVRQNLRVDELVQLRAQEACAKSVLCLVHSWHGLKR